MNPNHLILYTHTSIHYDSIFVLNYMHFNLTCISLTWLLCNKSLVLFTPSSNLNTFTFVLLTLFGTRTQAYGSSMVLQLPLPLNTNSKWIKRDLAELILTSVGRVWHGRLFKVTKLIGPYKLETNDSPKLPTVQTLNNSINIFFLTNPNIILCHFYSLNIYEYPKYHQNQYYHNRLKVHIHIHIIQCCSYYQMKSLFKY